MKAMTGVACGDLTGGVSRLDLGESRARPALRVPMTSLIDVVFILLLFFMLASSFRVERVARISALKEGQSAVPAADQEAIWLRVQADGRIEIEGSWLTPADPSTHQRLTALATGENVVNVQAVQPATVQQLMVWLDLMASAGVSRVRVAPSVAP